MRIPEIRAARTTRLRELVTECGSIAEVARRAGVSEKYLGQVLQGVTQQRGTSPRRLGDAVTERLEAAFEKPAGWMDTAPTASRDEASSRREAMAFDPWPFLTIWFGRFERLTPEQKQDLESLVEHQITRFEAKNLLPDKPRRAGARSKEARARPVKSKHAA